MFKLPILFTIVLALIFPSHTAWAASIPTTKAYKLTVTIPSSAGFTTNMNKASDLAQIGAQSPQRVQEQQVLRNHHPVIIKSIVVL